MFLENFQSQKRNVRKIRVSFFLACLENSPRASRRSCEISRAGNANFATGRKRWQKDGREKKSSRNCTVAGLDYTVTLASSMERTLEDVSVFLSSLSLARRRGSTRARETAQREHRRSRLNGFLTTSLFIPSASSLSSFSFFLLVLLRVSPVFLPVSLPPATPCSLRHANLLDCPDQSRFEIWDACMDRIWRHVTRILLRKSFHELQLLQLFVFMNFCFNDLSFYTSCAYYY